MFKWSKAGASLVLAALLEASRVIPSSAATRSGVAECRAPLAGIVAATAHKGADGELTLRLGSVQKKTRNLFLDLTLNTNRATWSASAPMITYANGYCISH